MRIVEHGLASGYKEEPRKIRRLEIVLDILAAIAILVILGIR